MIPEEFLSQEKLLERNQPGEIPRCDVEVRYPTFRPEMVIVHDKSVPAVLLFDLQERLDRAFRGTLVTPQLEAHATVMLDEMLFDLRYEKRLWWEPWARGGQGAWRYEGGLRL